MSGRTRWVVDAECSVCGKVKRYHVDNLLAGKTTSCTCTRAVKYDRDPRAITLGRRYDAMQQRCKDSGRAYQENYGARGIRNTFASREEYVRYVLANLPHPTYYRVDIDRKDNNGDYAPGNLRLVSRAENLLNTRRNRRYRFRGKAQTVSQVLETIRKEQPNAKVSLSWVYVQLENGLTDDGLLDAARRKSRRCRRAR